MSQFPDFFLPEGVVARDSGDDGRAEFALTLAILASRVALQYFRTDTFRVEKKRDRSPVTLADQEAEQSVRKALSERFPEDAILGEEFGQVEGNSEFEWIVDPIDGTKSFICGVPLYSTLVGLTRNGAPYAGVIAIPALGELAIGIRDRGAWYGNTHLGSSRSQEGTAIALSPTRVSDQDDLNEGLFLTSQADNFDRRGARDAYRQLESMAYISRSWGDGYGYLLVATGRGELMVDPIVNPWDIAAVAPVITEAGGTFSSWRGEYDIRAGHCLASNGRVHEAALGALRPFADRPIEE